MNKMWTIRQQSDRYYPMPEGDKHGFPLEIAAYGTQAQAEALAETLSNYYAGCDFYYYIEGGETG